MRCTYALLPHGGENRAALGQLVFQTGCLRWTRLGAIAPTTSTVRPVVWRCQLFAVLIAILVLYPLHAIGPAHPQPAEPARHAAHARVARAERRRLGRAARWCLRRAGRARRSRHAWQAAECDSRGGRHGDVRDASLGRWRGAGDA